MTRAKTIFGSFALAAAVLMLATIGSADDPLPPAVDPTSIFSPFRSPVLAAHALAVGHVPAQPPPPTSAGDLNLDGLIDDADFDLFTPCLAGDEGQPVGECPEAQMAAADLNGDGQVDIDDFQALVRLKSAMNDQ